MVGGTDTYGYLGSSETVTTIVGATTRVSALGADGSRVATVDGTTTGYLLPDLHGNVVAAEASASTTISNALRYDGYGQTLAAYTGTGPIAMDAKYQGRLDLSATSDPLYDMAARFYAPGTGTFTQLDSVLGSAQNPLSMNRFLYAEANPTTFIDPTGHKTTRDDGNPCTGIDCSVPPPPVVVCPVFSCYSPNPAPPTKPPTAPDDTTTGGATPPVSSTPSGDDWATDEKTPFLLKQVAGVWVGPTGAPFTERDLSKLYFFCTMNRDESACEAYRAGLAWFEGAEQAYCMDNAEICKLQAEERTLLLAVALEGIITVAAVLDILPGDEVVAGGVTTATMSRLTAIWQEIARLVSVRQPGIGLSGRTPAQSRALLNRNLLAEMGLGAERPTDSQAHHISELTRQGAALSRSVLAEHGIDIDSAVNGVFLKTNFHQTVPSRAAYTTEVALLLRNAQSREDVLATLQYVRAQLLAAQGAGTTWP